MFKRSIGAKLSASALLAVFVALGVALSFISWKILSDAREAARRESTWLVERVASTFAAYDDSSRDQARKDFQLFKSRMGGEFQLDTLGAEPSLRLGERVLNGHFELVDAFTRDSSGGVATVFARQGDDFLRVTTSLLNAKGERAFRTRLDRAHPAYPLMLEGKTFVGRASLFGKEYMTVYEPIRRQGQTIGILFTGTDIGALLERLSTNVRELKHGDSGAVYAVDVRPGANLGRFIGMREGVPALDLEHPAQRQWLDAFVTGPRDLSAVAAAGSPLDGYRSKDRLIVARRFEPWGLAIVADVPTDELLAQARGVVTNLWLTVAAVLVILTVVLVRTSHRLVARPLREMSKTLGRLATGDLATPIPKVTDDEIGRLCEDMESFRRQLAESLRQVRDGAGQVSSASREIAQGNQDLSGRTEGQAGALEQSVAAMHLLTETVRQNADNARSASELAQGAAAVAEGGSGVVAQVVHTMQSISASGQRIGDIVSLIDGIAFQTNILALNAAVEAALAGEQGRGFAVVAQEVRNLARRSAEAAGQVKRLIGDSVENIESGSALVHRAGGTMADIVDRVRRVTTLIVEISAASAEQSNGIAQVSSALGQMDKSTQGNAALVEELAAAGDSLRVQAQALDTAIQSFKV